MSKVRSISQAHGTIVWQAFCTLGHLAEYIFIAGKVNIHNIPNLKGLLLHEPSSPEAHFSLDWADPWPAAERALALAEWEAHKNGLTSSPVGNEHIIPWGSILYGGCP